MTMNANLTCSDLENTHWDQAEEFKSIVQHAPKMTYANVRGVQPESFRKWALSEGAVDLSHDDWLSSEKLSQPARTGSSLRENNRTTCETCMRRVEGMLDTI